MHLYLALLCLEGFRYQVASWVEVSNNFYFLVNNGPLIQELHFLAPTSRNTYPKVVSLSSFIMLEKVQVSRNLLEC
jgi:hypothetical protein